MATTSLNRMPRRRQTLSLLNVCANLRLGLFVIATNNLSVPFALPLGEAKLRDENARLQLPMAVHVQLFAISRRERSVHIVAESSTSVTTCSKHAHSNLYNDHDHNTKANNKNNENIQD